MAHKRKTIEAWMARGWRPEGCPFPASQHRGRMSTWRGGCAYPYQRCTGPARLCPSCNLPYCAYHGPLHAAHRGTGDAAAWSLHAPQKGPKPAPVRRIPPAMVKHQFRARRPSQGPYGASQARAAGAARGVSP